MKIHNTVPPDMATNMQAWDTHDIATALVASSMQSVVRETVATGQDAVSLGLSLARAFLALDDLQLQTRIVEVISLLADLKG